MRPLVNLARIQAEACDIERAGRGLTSASSSAYSRTLQAIQKMMAEQAPAALVTTDPYEAMLKL
jgi:hypothetical protein